MGRGSTESFSTFISTAVRALRISRLKRERCGEVTPVRARNCGGRAAMCRGGKKSFFFELFVWPSGNRKRAFISGFRTATGSLTVARVLIHSSIWSCHYWRLGPLARALARKAPWPQTSFTPSLTLLNHVLITSQAVHSCPRAPVIYPKLNPEPLPRRT